MYVVTNCIVNWLIRNEVIDDKERDLYEYSAYCFIITIIPLIIVGVFSLCIHGLPQYILIVLPFMILRQYSGGYHAPKAWICITLSSIILSVCVYWGTIITTTMGCISCTIEILSCVLLLKNSPMESSNRKLSYNERVLYHKKLKVCLTTLILIQLITLTFHWNIVSNSIVTSIILAELSQLPSLLLIRSNGDIRKDKRNLLQ